MTYFLRRIALAVLVLFGVSILIFVLDHLLPGDVVNIIVGTEGQLDASEQANLRHQFGLDQSWPVQYLAWLGNLLHGNLGQSFRTDQPVLPLILGRLPTTFELAALAVLLAVIVAIPLGTISGLWRNGWADLAARLLGLIGLSVPNFWLATLLIIFAAFEFHWMPALIFIPPTKDLLGNLQQMFLPSLSISVGLMAIIMRMTRSAVIDTLGEDHVRVARAKGLPNRLVVIRHVVRNSMIPVVTVVGLQAGYLLGGTVIIEQIFGLPGVGWTLVNAVYQRDYPVVQGTVLCFAVTFVVVNLLVDLVYLYLDPRIRYG